MKKWFGIVCVMGMLCFLTACGKNSTWFRYDGYHCVIDYENNIVTISFNNEELAKIPFIIKQEDGVYFCEVTFPDKSSYWSRRPKGRIVKERTGGYSVFYSSDEEVEFGYRDGYENQLVKGEVLTREIISNYIILEETQTKSKLPIGRMVFSAFCALLGFRYLWKPETLLGFEQRWILRNIAPSDNELNVTRISGGVLLIVAFLILLTLG